MHLNKGTFLYEGKAKQVYGTEDPDKIIIHYKDDATAFNAQKRGTIQDKGVLNNQITSLLFNYLKKKSIPSHFIEKLNDRDQLCQKVSIIPLEIIVRNRLAGSTAKKIGVDEGKIIPNIVYELCYKRDELGDPLINDHHAVALGLASYEDLKFIYQETEKINKCLTELFDSLGIILVDFKLEFGKNSKGEIILSDEISPDTCRFWEKETLRKIDKDRFRRDLGGVREAYQEILDKLLKSPQIN